MAIPVRELGHRIEVLAVGGFDPSGSGMISRRPVKVFNIHDDSLTHRELEQIAQLLADPVAERTAVDAPVLDPEEWLGDRPGTVIEVSPKPAVNDPEGRAARKAMQHEIGREIGPVSYAKQYLWSGPVDAGGLSRLEVQLGTPEVHHFRAAETGQWKGFGFHYPEVTLPPVPAFTYISLGRGDEELLALSKARYLALNLEEMRAIQQLYRGKDFIAARASVGLEAQATDAELELSAQAWSEHCKHKKFNAIWEYASDDPDDESGLLAIADSIFRSIIVPAAEEIAQRKPWMVSIFEDNAGIVQLNQGWNLAHKVETHNHPSQLHPRGGAETGIGGDERDVEGVGIGFITVAGGFGFRVPHPDAYTDLPPGIIPPREVLSGIAGGVGDYGNRMGYPTQTGSVMIDDGWLKPGVYVDSVSVQRAEISGRPTHIKNIRPGYLAISLGGKVGKDGIHGATGSSMDLRAGDEQRKDVNQSVQIGDPITQKGVFEVMEILAEQGLSEAVQDCGAGGWNSAIGELTGLLDNLQKERYAIRAAFAEKRITAQSSVAERLAAAPILRKAASPFYQELEREVISGEMFSHAGAGRGGFTMDLTHVPEKYSGLTGWEKLISEAQERMVVVIRPGDLDRVREICDYYNVEMTEMGVFNDTGYYHVKDQDRSIAFLPVDFIERGLPKMRIRAHWTPSKNTEPDLPVQDDLTEMLLALVSRPNIQSYEEIFRIYDHEVRGGSRLKPVVGLGNGKSDAIAYQPVLSEPDIIIQTWGSNPGQGDIDAYHMGVNNVVDAVGRVIAAGGSLDQITFNGNTTCPKPEDNPAVAAQVIRMIKGSADAELAFDTPKISGKDSTSMERSYISTKTGGKVLVKAKPELLMSALGVVHDDTTITSPDFKLPGDLVYVIGKTRDELGASEFYAMHGKVGRNVPRSDLSKLPSQYRAVESAIRQGLVHSAQYLGKGGIAAGLSNAAIGGDVGVAVDLDTIDDGLGRADKILMSESTGRFIVSVHPAQRAAFEQAMEGQYAREVGRVSADRLFDDFTVKYQGRTVVQTGVPMLRVANKGEIRI